MSIKRFWGRGAAAGELVALDKESLNHAKAVRIREGEEAELMDGVGNFWRGVYQKNGVRVEKAGRVEKIKPEIILAVGVTQGGTMEDIVRQAVELGVGEIIPVQTRNAAPALEPKRADAKHERWERIAEEACKQSGLYWKPRVWPVTKFADVLVWHKGAQDIVAALGQPVTPWGSLPAPKEKILVWVGPEGGFDREEMAQLRAGEAYFVTLGGTVLRVETACVAALTRTAQWARGE